MVAEFQYPNFGNSLLQGMQIRNALESRKDTAVNREWESEQRDRKRKEWAVSDNAIVQAKQKRLTDDARTIYSNLNTDDPGFENEFELAAKWFTERNPDGQEMVAKLSALPVEQKKEYIKQSRAQINMVDPKNQVMKPGEVMFDRFGQKVVEGNPVAPKPERIEPKSNLGRLLSEQEKTKPGSKAYNFYQKKIDLETTRRPLVGGSGGGSGWGVNGGVLSSKDEILARQLASGRVTTKQLGKRTGDYNGVVARAFELNPDLDLVVSEADEKLMGNASFRVKKNMAESLDDVLVELTKTGKKLNFSRVGVIGKGQAAVKSQLNDPDFRYYMSLRNDAVQTLTNVMRGVGMSDKSVELELESMPKAMDPASFEAWYKGQKAALEPRLKFYKNVESGGKAFKKPAQASQGSSKVYNELPPAQRYRGKIATDDDTGKKYKSDGKKWVEVR